MSFELLIAFATKEPTPTPPQHTRPRRNTKNKRYGKGLYGAYYDTYKEAYPKHWRSKIVLKDRSVISGGFWETEEEASRKSKELHVAHYGEASRFYNEIK